VRESVTLQALTQVGVVRAEGLECNLGILERRRIPAFVIRVVCPIQELPKVSK
jgi:hypothetical protein